MILRRRKSHVPGARVAWRGEGAATEGVVRKVFTHRLERTMKGSIVTFDACKKNPGYLIERDNGDTLLKAHRDLTRVA